MDTEKDLSDKKRPKRFLVVLLAAAAGVQLLVFHWPLGRQLHQPWNAPKAHGVSFRKKCQKSRGLLQQEQNLGKTLQGTIFTVNLHSALINNTVHALETLTGIVKEDNL